MKMICEKCGKKGHQDCMNILEFFKENPEFFKALKNRQRQAYKLNHKP